MSVSLLHKWLLLQGIFADVRLSQSAKVVGGVLLDCLNSNTLRCCPSLALLEQRACLKRRSVTAALSQLRLAGWIKRRARRGTSYYSFDLALVGAPETAHLPSHDEHPIAQRSQDEGHRSADLNPEHGPDPAHLGAYDAQELAKLEAQNTARLYRSQETDPIRKRETLSPSFGRQVRSGPAEAEIDAMFENWWSLYPKHVEKLAARRVFGRLLKAGTVTLNELTAGVERYRTYCRRRAFETRFIKGPAAWLTDGRWADEVVIDTDPPSPSRRETSNGWSNLDFGDQNRGSNKGPVIEGEFRHVD